jgi:hypothetical protein
MGMYEDFVNFVDGGSYVPYFQDNCKYSYLPNIISSKFDYEFKTYYKSCNKYFVGVPFSKFVREIRASDFHHMFNLYEIKNKKIEFDKKKKQLIFQF